MGARLNISVGQEFGRLIIIEESEQVGNKRFFKVACSCGSNQFTIRLDHLTRGVTKSCGCLQKEAVKAANTIHGQYNTTLYHVWEAMLQRCFNTKHKSYVNYGARGITVCEDWLKFIPFWEWAKLHYKEGLEIERVDNYGNYEPSNCTFATRSMQCFNRRPVRDLKTGVVWDEEKNKWKAEIAHQFLGRFDNYEDAVLCREMAELQYYGFIKE